MRYPLPSLLENDVQWDKIVQEKLAEIDRLKADNERLRAREFEERPPNMQCADLIIRDLKADNERLRAALQNLLSVVDVTNPASDPAIEQARRALEETK